VCVIGVTDAGPALGRMLCRRLLHVEITPLGERYCLPFQEWRVSCNRAGCDQRVLKRWTLAQLTLMIRP